MLILDLSPMKTFSLRAGSFEKGEMILWEHFESY
jgi:hypothetical protein